MLKLSVVKRNTVEIMTENNHDSDDSVQKDQLQAEDLVLEEIDAVDSEVISKTRKSSIRIGVAAIVAVGLLAVVIILGRSLSKGRAEPAASAPTLDIDEVLSYFLPPYSLEIAKSNSSSAQAQAYAWLKSDAQLNEYYPYRLQQRYALAVLYFATNGESWKNSTGWLSNTNECTWHSETELTPSKPFTKSCEENSTFSVLHLAYNKLLGTIPSELGLLTNLKSMQLYEPFLSFAIYPEL
jgi:hypothetical protein